MLNWQKIFSGGLTKPDENGVQHRQSYKQVLRPIEEMYLKLLRSADAMLRHKTSVYMTLVSATVAGSFLVFTPFGWALQGAVLSSLHLGNRNDVIQVRFPSIVSLLGTTASNSKSFNERVDQGMRAAAEVAAMYGAGIAGNYSGDLARLSGKFPAEQIAQVAMAIDRTAADPTAETASVCRTTEDSSGTMDAGCLKIEGMLRQGTAASMLVAKPDEISRIVEVLSKGRTSSISKDTCAKLSASGFYGAKSILHYSPLVYVTASPRADISPKLNTIRKQWQADDLDMAKAGATKVSTLRELFSHRLAGSCDPLQITFFDLDGKTTRYLVSVLVAEGQSVGTALFMLYDLDAAGVKDRGMVRLQTANLVNRGNLANDSGRAEEIGAPQAAQTYSEIAKQMGREGLSVDIESPNSKDVGFLSALIQPKSK